MKIALLLLAVLCLVAGHCVKTIRWRLLLEMYEKPNMDNLLQALSIGYLFNFILPVRIGELIRAVIAGKKMQNGIAFSFATIVMDRYLDVLVVGGLFAFFIFFDILPFSFVATEIIYLLLSFIILVFAVVAMKYREFIKKIINSIASLFNENIERNILLLGWALITVFKDVIYRIRKWPLLVSTVIMWICYMLSYGCMAMALSTDFHTINFIDIFVALFAHGNLDTSTMLSIKFVNFDFYSKILLFAYLFIPIIVLFLFGLMLKIINKSNTETVETVSEKLKLLPHYNRKDQLQFLENYFANTNRDYLEQYLRLNQNINILQDFSAGSNATTILCMDAQGSFFRKYAFGDEAEKLNQQVLWIEAHKNDIPLPEIIRKIYEPACCSYDMPYYVENIGFFGAVHSMPMESSWAVLKDVLQTLHNNLYSKNFREMNKDSMKQYIDNKVVSNLKKIINSHQVAPLLAYDELIINGKHYKNLSVLKKYLAWEHLAKVFANDQYSVIHGDLTIENIVFSYNKYDYKREHQFYLIDPNTGNIHESPFLDYAKLLQSLHGGYEFLMKTENVTINDNNIEFRFIKSEAYGQLYTLLLEYLNDKFSFGEIKSIFYHEIVHWLRLLPYKLEKNGKRALLFYAGFIMILNDIVDTYECGEYCNGKK